MSVSLRLYRRTCSIPFGGQPRFASRNFAPFITSQLLMNFTRYSAGHLSRFRLFLGSGSPSSRRVSKQVAIASLLGSEIKPPGTNSERQPFIHQPEVPLLYIEGVCCAKVFISDLHDGHMNWLP